MIETKEKTINGSKYSVTQFTAFKALRIQNKLIKLLGPSLGCVFSSYDPKDPDKGLPLALKMLAEQLDEDVFENLVIEILQTTRKSGHELKRDLINMEFSGKLNELFLVLQFVLEVNYADFFSEGGIITNLLEKSSPLIQE